MSSLENNIKTIPVNIAEVESFLEPINQNYKNLKRFKRICNRSNTVSFIGAGTSKPLGVADWTELIKDLKEYVKIKYSFKSNKSTYPEIAEDIFRYLEKKNDAPSYFDIIIKKMTPKISTTSLTLIKLIMFTNVHLTTNFDKSIENAYNFLKYLSEKIKVDKLKKTFIKYEIPDFGEYNHFNDKGYIYYLHGNIERKVFILKKSDYETYYPSVSNKEDCDDSLEDCIKRFFKEKNIMFIGFSFTDEYIKNFLFGLAKKNEIARIATSELYSQSEQVYNPRCKSHFLIMDSSNKEWKEKKEKLFEELQQFNIFPIIYKSNQHIFLEYLFDLMSRREEDILYV